jgi:hypothetical protein
MDDQIPATKLMKAAYQELSYLGSWVDKSGVLVSCFFYSCKNIGVQRDGQNDTVVYTFVYKYR